jgi:hypothetical protein
MKRKSFIPLLLGCTLFVLSSNRLVYSQGIGVTNVSFSIRGSDIVVHYDLNGSTDKLYNVELVLKRETQPYFKMLPKDISGDVGTGKFAGKHHEIVWHLFSDVPDGLDGNDYYFEVSATLLGAEKEGTSWLYYVGAAVVGGAAAVFLGRNLFTKGSSGAGLPSPPGRP